MKKTIVSLVLGLTLSSAVYADDLATVYELAQANDPIINRAKAQKDAAFAGIGISRANLLPQISGSIGYSISNRDNEFSQPVTDSDGNPVLDPDGNPVVAQSIAEIETDALTYGLD
jgi:outer membrane protein